jgi:CBS domain-containing protein
MIEHRTTLRGTVRRAMITELRVLDADAPLETAMEHILAGFQQDFPVLERDRPIGVLTRDDLLGALARHGAALPIRAAMTAEFVMVTPDESLADALAQLQSSRCHTLLVIEGLVLVGIVNLENIMELLLIQKALDSRLAKVNRLRETAVI